MDSGDEPVDVVDEHDEVIGRTTRRAMRAGRLRHRSVFIVVRNSQGEVLVHRRSDHKDVWPGRWDMAAGGVLASGESYEDGARRELAEELGVFGSGLEAIARGRYDDEDVSEVSAVFTTVWDGPIQFSDGEVVEARWVTVPELIALTQSATFVPDSLALVLPHVAAPYAHAEPADPERGA